MRKQGTNEAAVFRVSRFLGTGDTPVGESCRAVRRSIEAQPAWSQDATRGFLCLLGCFWCVGVCFLWCLCCFVGGLWWCATRRGWWLVCWVLGVWVCGWFVFLRGVVYVLLLLLRGAAAGWVWSFSPRVWWWFENSRACFVLLYKSFDCQWGGACAVFAWVPVGLIPSRF